MSGRAIFLALLVASLAGNVSFLVTALAAGARGAPASGGGAIDHLGLTPAQTLEFEDMRRAFQSHRRHAHTALGRLREAFAEEYGRERPQREKLTALTADMAQVQTDMRPRLVDHLLALHALLTPAQREAFGGLMRSGSGPGPACPGAMLYAPSEPGSEAGP